MRESFGSWDVDQGWLLLPWLAPKRTLGIFPSEPCRAHSGLITNSHRRNKMVPSIENIFARARCIHEGPFRRQRPLYLRLIREGQAPGILMISCSDSRVDPSAIFAVEPGKIFMVRNIAGLVPPLGMTKLALAQARPLNSGSCISA